MKPIPFDKFPNDVRLLLIALARELQGRRLRPELVRANAGITTDLVVGHAVEIRHTARALLGGKSGRYELSIHGARWDGSVWNFWPGELEELLRQAAK